MAGINTAQKLRKQRKKFLNKKSTRFSTFPTFKGTVLAPLDKEAKQPSSGTRSCWKISTRKGVLIAYSPKDGVKNLIKIHDTVTIGSIGGSNGRSMGDIPGARFKIIKIGRNAVNELFLGKKTI